MSQPPDEPPADDAADPGWHPPGPTPPPPPPPPQYPTYPYPYGQPPPQPNPYGGGTSDVYRPIDSGGMPSAVKIVLGAVIGLFVGFVLWIVAALGFVSVGSSEDSFLLFAALTPLIVPAPLLIWPATRPWGVGLLIGTAISSIGLSSLCSSLINSV